VGILLVEQDVTLGVGVANRVHCLLEGKTALTGTPEELSAEQIEQAISVDMSVASAHESNRDLAQRHHPRCAGGRVLRAVRVRTLLDVRVMR